MVPTPEAISQAQEKFKKEIEEPLRGVILGTVEAVKKGYCLRNNIRSEDFFKLLGFIFDLTPSQSKGESLVQTVHPVFEIYDKIKGGYTPRVFCGKDFTEERTVTSWTEERTVTSWRYAVVEWAWNMEVQYPIRSSFVGDLFTVYVEISGDLELLNQDVEKQMIIGLANAAGIKPEDESSAEFPLLLKELKRIKAGLR